MTPDSQARLTALDVSRSFIVQAPAGSGKTELLTQRLLALLAGVTAPEEILAITFTRKAAAEMRNRLLETLVHAREVMSGAAEEPSKAHEKDRHELAAAALARDEELGWGLLDHPSRLRIQTIDSLCASLVARMPVLAQLGGGARPAEDAQSHYLEAARQTLAELEDGTDGPEVQALRRVLRHQDNDLSHLEKLIAAMLARREQWLPDVHALNDDPKRVREWLERQLEAQSEACLARLKEALGPGFQHEIIPSARHAAANLAGNENSHIPYLTDWETPMAYSVDALPAWLGVAELCLTAAGSPRKAVNKNCGFPPEGKAEKQAFQTFLSGLSEAQAMALSDLRDLPPAFYSDEQWQTLAALIVVLRGAAGRLWLRFMAQGEVDFTEIQARALMALGTPEAPTDLALALDYRIRHILVDEFQDTNNTQWRLLEGLTAGWQAGDGRSLFLVGDPMQSIYLFRQAEVGLFLQAQEQGLGQTRLEALSLSANFRSQAGIVDWVNESFRGIFPSKPDALRGGVPLCAAQATHPALPEPAVRVHAFIEGLSYDPESLEPTASGLDARSAEAERVRQLVQEALAENASVAVLVRGRSHLASIAPALSRAGIPYQAVDIDPLASRQYIADLLSLTRALLLPGDRVHWLSVLRAPWCGLTLSDLFALCGDDADTGIPRLLADDARLARMSAEGAEIARRCRDILLPLAALHGRLSLRDRVERAWLQLGGESLLPEPAAREDVVAYLDLVEGMADQGAFDPDELAAELARLFAAPQAAAGVQLMTIHKSKGLEFDTVILPGLDHKPPANRKVLLQWLPVPQGLLIAPVHAVGADRDSLYQYIARLYQEKQDYELQRLLYVACTRAKSHLHLLAVARVSGQEEPVPKAASRSLLALLWPQVEAEFLSQPRPETPEEARAEIPPSLPLLRLPAAWRPERPALHPFVLPVSAEPEAHETDAVHREATASGSATHRLLQRIADEGVASWDEARLKSLAPFVLRLVERQGLYGEVARRAVARTLGAVARCLDDKAGRWLLGPHPIARNEWALSSQEPAGPAQHIIDRYFETEDGSRWVVDYKTDALPEPCPPEALEAFVSTRLEHHRPQLERYARLLSALDPRPLKLALYFTSLPRLAILPA
ncbi:MAG: UvrD-helicase domain-containing protein [Rhodocyclaceae bacterium]|nr:UvrD-helicase domain-containing protein [Rhodocyclaceae bacterium]